MYRVLIALLDPYLWLLILLGVGQGVVWWKRPTARKLLLAVAIPYLFLLAISIPAVVRLAAGTLERQYPPLAKRPSGTDAILVLGGYVRPPDPWRPYAELGEDTLYRCLTAARLYHEGPPCLVVVSGGKVDPSEPGPTLAAAMADFLVQHGVPRSRIVLEDRSRSTYENAVESARLLREHDCRRVVLVTDAMHLWRAELCLAAQGVSVIPCGARYAALKSGLDLEAVLPNASAVQTMGRLAHEWIGVAWYWGSGRFEPAKVEPVGRILPPSRLEVVRILNALVGVVKRDQLTSPAVCRIKIC